MIKNFDLQKAVDENLASWSQKEIKMTLAKGRNKGRYGWFDPKICSQQQLEKECEDHIEKFKNSNDPGQLVDAAVFLLMKAWLLKSTTLKDD